MHKNNKRTLNLRKKVQNQMIYVINNMGKLFYLSNII